MAEARSDVRKAQAEQARAAGQEAQAEALEAAAELSQMRAEQERASTDGPQPQSDPQAAKQANAEQAVGLEKMAERAEQMAPKLAAAVAVLRRRLQAAGVSLDNVPQPQQAQQKGRFPQV